MLKKTKEEIIRKLKQSKSKSVKLALRENEIMRVSMEIFWINFFKNLDRKQKKRRETIESLIKELD